MSTVSENLRILNLICENAPMLMRRIPENEFNELPAKGKWSKKQILGHLIDSATNNHHRFIRAQFEDDPVIIYDQVKLVEHGYYEKSATEQLIRFWEVYNLQLIELITNLPPHLYERKCITGGNSAVTTADVFDSYILHLKHHLKQIIGEI